MPGVVAHVPNEGPKFVPISTKILALCATEIVAHVRQALCVAIGLKDEDDFSVLFAERDLCEGEKGSEDAFKEKLQSGKPCMVRVLFRMLGGKGGFGALLRKQANQGKKTKNFDAMRNLDGRRLRHSNAVDRIKEWMEKKNVDDELVEAIAGKGPELPKPTPASETLDPEFIKKLKRTAIAQAAVVGEGMRLLDAEAPAKRAHLDASGGAAGSSSSSSAGKWDLMADVSSSSPDGEGSPDGERSPDGEETNDKSADSKAVKFDPTADTMGASSAAAKPRHWEGRYKADKASKKVFASDKKETPAIETVLAPAPTASALAEAIADSFCNATDVEKVEQKAKRVRNGGLETNTENLSPAVECLGAGDLAGFKDAADLLAKVPAETLKQSLQKLGLKCGGTPDDRAARLFQLKNTPLEDVPKKDLAKK